MGKISINASIQIGVDGIYCHNCKYEGNYECLVFGQRLLYKETLNHGKHPRVRCARCISAYPQHDLIPVGPYCHTGSKTCMYWKKISARREQEDGWCTLLGKGDVEIERETGGVSLLWDQCKACGINDDDQEA